MRRNLSVYPDVLRIGAAFAVLFGHARMETLPSLPAFLGIHFSEAVAVFFVLSGLVIGYVTARAESDWTSYAFARAIRIMPVVLVSIIVTYGFDYAGWLANPQFYQATPAGNPGFSFYDVISYLTFTNEIWMNDISVGTNHPIWSIGFEVWYYVMFGLGVFLTGKVRALAIIGVAIMCGPKIMLYFPLWLIGLATYRLIASNRFSMRWPNAVLLFMLSMAAYAAVKKLWGQQVGAAFAWEGAGVSLPTCVYFTTIGLIFAVNIIAFDQATKQIAFFGARVTQVVRWVAGATFTMYLMHGPILLSLTAILTGWRPGTASRIVALVLTIALVFVVAELAERRKRQTATLVRLCVSRWIRTRRGRPFVSFVKP